ncbi:CAP domain-containing protein [Aureimonas sp. AU20]|uniref:CAP domain-containing protein n=1 Tax=Aureimonas sp. AU20 TaxID=1349819 RepID=UPI0011E03196|nr:CAP domain-containing protein [Aureimonas sp. AU20]
MKTPSLRALMLCLSLGLGACTTVKPVDTSRTAPLAIGRDEGLKLVNDFRARNGLKPLRINEKLMQAAQWQTAAMAERNKMDHQVAGALPGRVARFGYDWSTVAENIARNYSDYGAAMVGWINSPGHRKNLLNPNVTEMGFAGGRLSEGGPTYWTQIFGAPKPVAPVAVSQKPMRWGPELRFP